MLDILNQFREFRTFEVVFFDSKRHLQKIICSLRRIDSNSVAIVANNRKNKNVIAKVGDDLKLYLYAENGIYSATSKILIVRKDTFNTEYIISYPENSKHSQRREYFRADLEVKFAIKRPVGSFEDVVIVDGVTKNMCGKGMSFLSDKPFLESDSIEVNLYFPDRTINTTAELVYAKQIIVEDELKFINAFVFTTISGANINYIVKKCFLYQLKLRKK